MSLILHGDRRWTAAYRVRIALALKGLQAAHPAAQPDADPA